MVYFLAFLQAQWCVCIPCMVAKTIGEKKDSLKELVAHVRRSIRRPWVLVDFQTLLFWEAEDEPLLFLLSSPESRVWS